jgi:hypothetical protein
MWTPKVTIQISSFLSKSVFEQETEKTGHTPSLLHEFFRYATLIMKKE